MSSKDIRRSPKRFSLIEYSETNGTISFDVRVVPRSSQTEIVGEHDGALKIKLASPPVEGAANEELTRFLAKTFGVSKGNVDLISGQHSKCKKVRITGAGTDKIASILQLKS